MEQGWDPDVKRFLRKVLYSFTYGLIWLIGNATAGIYFHLAYRDGQPLIYTLLFYVLMFFSLGLLIRYYYRTWKE